MSRTLTAVLADDHAAVLQRASRCLSPVCEILATVSDGSAAVEAIMRLHPDIAVLKTSPCRDSTGSKWPVK